MKKGTLQDINLERCLRSHIGASLVSDNTTIHYRILWFVISCEIVVSLLSNLFTEPRSPHSYGVFGAMLLRVGMSAIIMSLRIVVT